MRPILIFIVAFSSLPQATNAFVPTLPSSNNVYSPSIITEMDDYENTFATIEQYHQISCSPSTTHHQRSIVTKLNNKKKKVIKKKRGTGGGGFAGALKDLQMKSFRYSGTIQPGVQTPQKVVAEGDVIALPDYAGDGIVSLKYFCQEIFHSACFLYEFPMLFFSFLFMFIYLLIL